jgi:hypothetical protein
MATNRFVENGFLLKRLTDSEECSSQRNFLRFSTDLFLVTPFLGCCVLILCLCKLYLVMNSFWLNGPQRIFLYFFLGMFVCLRLCSAFFILFLFLSLGFSMVWVFAHFIFQFYFSKSLMEVIEESVSFTSSMSCEEILKKKSISYQVFQSIKKSLIFDSFPVNDGGKLCEAERGESPTMFQHHFQVLENS